MSFLNKVREMAIAGRNELATKVARFENKKFMEGTVAICAFIAAADGAASGEEKQKMVGFIKTSDELKVFETTEVIAFFEKISKGFEFDADIGRGEALKYIVALKSDAGAAQLALRVGVAVAKSDGNFDSEEREAVRVISLALGLNPADFC